MQLVCIINIGKILISTKIYLILSRILIETAKILLRDNSRNKVHIADKTKMSNCSGDRIC